MRHLMGLIRPRSGGEARSRYSQLLGGTMLSLYESAKAGGQNIGDVRDTRVEAQYSYF